MASNFPDNQLTANALQAIRGQRMLFTDLGFELHSGKALRVEGANGVGKTTLLRMMVGLVFINEGNVLWNAQMIQDCRTEYHESLHYLGHQTALKLALTPHENLQFIQSFSGLPQDQTAINEALNFFNLEAQKDLPCYALSAGQKQRVALARLLLIKKPLWVLDEAFTSLDINVIEKFEGLMEKHLQANGSIIFTSHQELQANNFEYQRLLLSGEFS